MNPVQIIMQPQVIRGMTMASSVLSMVLSGKNLAQMKHIDKKWWYLALAATAIAGVIIVKGMQVKQEVKS